MSQETGYFLVGKHALPKRPGIRKGPPESVQGSAILSAAGPGLLEHARSGGTTGMEGIAGARFRVDSGRGTRWANGRLLSLPATARQRPGQSGLTLVELLIALALIGFILLGVAPLFIASVKSNYSANEYTSINMIARDRLEQLMNRSFTDAELNPGVKANDLSPVLPDPKTGIPPASGGIGNPFSITYQVTQWSIPPSTGAGSPATAPPGSTSCASAPCFNPTRVTALNNPFQYKRIDVTVVSGTGLLGIGARVSRVSGCLANPSPALTAADCSTPGVICSQKDACAIGDPAHCS
ncbi:MAG TPA: prepilin-type N-terminal cleavage/methylation domain-containing protein [Thermoanaerobaculia bacterium]|nr:prepilin-type N-terminal cleavage/methylation domain-containing protein [Thermoanaerobaculia bacterium]